MKRGRDEVEGVSPFLKRFDSGTQDICSKFATLIQRLIDMSFNSKFTVNDLIYIHDFAFKLCCVYNGNLAYNIISHKLFVKIVEIYQIKDSLHAFRYLSIDKQKEIMCLWMLARRNRVPRDLATQMCLQLFNANDVTDNTLKRLCKITKHMSYVNRCCRSLDIPNKPGPVLMIDVLDSKHPLVSILTLIERYTITMVYVNNLPLLIWGTLQTLESALQKDAFNKYLFRCVHIEQDFSSMKYK
jgi:hypothetical protein